MRFPFRLMRGSRIPEILPHGLTATQGLYAHLPKRSSPRLSQPSFLDPNETVDEIYRRVEKRLVADPARYEFHYISVAALLTRT